MLTYESFKHKNVREVNVNVIPKELLAKNLANVSMVCSVSYIFFKDHICPGQL